jgi:hypothetical protein
MRSVRRWIGRLRRRPPRLDDPALPPDDEPALVPRRPLRPLGSGSVALELPEEPGDVDARGREL